MSTSAGPGEHGPAQLTDPNPPPGTRWDEEPEPFEPRETPDPPIADEPRLLMRRAVAGDDGAFARLVEHFDPMLRELTITLLGDPGAMDDVLHDTYVKAYRALPTVAADVEPGPWLYRLAYLGCLVELRRRHRRRARTPPARPAARTPEPPDATHPITDTNTGTGTSAFARALAALPPDHQAAVLLADRGDLRVAAIARVLGQPQAIAAKVVTRARARLRAALDEDGPEPEHDT